MARVVRRNVRLYAACADLVREVDATADAVEDAGLHRLAQWMRRPVLTLALLVCERDPDEARALAEADRVGDDLVVAARHLGVVPSIVRAELVLERVRDLIGGPAGPEGTPRVVSDPVPTVAPG